ncbi:MAG: histidine kinase, partial [Pseudorhodoplanes sp.]
MDNIDLNDHAEMFELAPVSLWLEDYSALKALYEVWRSDGVTDLRAHFAADPARVWQCSACIRLIKVNRKTLSLFEATDADHLIANLGRVFRDDMLATHVDELVQLWHGKPQ